VAGDDERDLPTEELRAAFAVAPVGLESAACPPPEEVWDALHGSSSPARRAAIVDHVARCGRCAESWRLAVRGTPRLEDRR
jgi:hypothetical protein